MLFRIILGVGALVLPLSFAQALGEDDADRHALTIAATCSEIWATDSIEQLDELGEALDTEHRVPMEDAYDLAYDAALDYQVASDNYREKYVATISAVLDLAGKAGDQTLWQKAWEEGSQPHKPQSEFDGLIDAVIEGKGVDVLSHVTDILVSEAAVDNALADEHAAKEIAVAARRAVLAADAKAHALEIVMFAIETCTADQRSFLDGAGPDPAG